MKFYKYLTWRKMRKVQTKDLRSDQEKKTK